MLLKNGNIILEDRILRNTDVLVKEGKIISIGFFDSLENTQVIDCEGLYVSPGYIDIHVHGGAGCLFIDAAKESFDKILSIHTKHGTSTIYPTFSAAEYGKTIEAIEAIDDYVKETQNGKNQIYCNIEGIHLEGPYFNKDFRGAQSEKYIRKPESSEYSKLLTNPIVKRISYAPEIDEDMLLTKYISEKNIIGAVAHSGADFDKLKEALDMGVKLMTHLYSGMPTVYRENAFRKIGIPETAFLIDEFFVEVIGDGKHLPPELLSLIYKIKGAEKIALVTDGTRAAGLDTNMPGFAELISRLGIIVKDGVAFTPDMQSFSGSIATMDILVKNMFNLANASLPDAIKMASLTPARIMGIDSRKGKIAAGMEADILLLSESLDVIKVIISGKTACF